MTTFPKFAKRRNWNSSFDSICIRCYQTIATANSEEELAAHEQKHTCDPDWAYSHSLFGSGRGARTFSHAVDKIQAG